MGGAAAPPGANLDRDRLCAFYQQMWRIRAFEEWAIRGAEEGEVFGTVHPSIGQEAVAVAICGNLRGEDVLLSTHRGHGHTLIKGADPYAMMCELLGRADGTCGGKGGSMHIADFGIAMLGANGVVGANTVIAVGAAQRLKYLRSDRIVACIFGDGAVNRGTFLEALNWASIHGLPVLFVCEDNRYSASTRTADLTAGEGAAARGAALGVETMEADGNDVLALDATAREAVGRVREGRPLLLVARTYRLVGHTSRDPAAYRPEEEVAAARERDPIARCAALLRLAGIAESWLTETRDAARAEMEAVYLRARNAAWPPPDRAAADVQDVGSPAERPF